MSHQHGRHHADRPQGSRRSIGLPRPGQALLGFHPPEPSLFGVPQQRQASPGETSMSADDGRTSVRQPPRPRTAPDDWPSLPRAVTQRRNWLPLIGIPLAVITLGVALGVITVVMLIAAGTPVPLGH
jgi:hypothetical protein